MRIQSDHRNMVERQRYQTRLSPDRADRVDDYAAKRDLTQSEAVRRLIVAGLDASDQPTTKQIAADLRELREEIEADEAEAELHQDPTSIYQSIVVALLLLIFAAQMGLFPGL